jgi:hypothetical protein
MNIGSKRSVRAATMACALTVAQAAFGQSTCFGEVGDGRIVGAVALPREGANLVRLAQGPMTAGPV